jgi:aminobenzoyl-glutamate transport protein
MSQKVELSTQTGIKKSLFGRFLDRVEALGNSLPDPSVLFLLLCGIIIVLSWIGAKLGWSAVHPGTGDKLVVFNLLSAEGIQYMFSSIVTNVTSYAPFGIAVIIMTSVGLLDDSGLLKAMFIKMGLSVSKRTLTLGIVFLGIMANMASDIGFIVMPPLAALLFMAAGRNPIVGMCCSYAACACGMAANLVVTVGDATITGITLAAANIVDPNFTMSPACNWYIMSAAVFVLTPVAVLVTEKVVEPRAGKWEVNEYAPKFDLESYQPSELEKKGLRITGIVMLAVVAIIILAVTPVWGVLINADGVPIIAAKGTQLPSIVALITLLMGLPGIIYGKVVGTIKDSKQFGQACTKGLISIAPLILICVIAGQFVGYFGKSNLALIFAAKGTDLIKSIGIAPLPLLIIMILFFILSDFFIVSSSAKWTMFAPVFVPMFMMLGYHPSVLQGAYRIGDSVANAVTPFLAYFAILIGFAHEYDKKAGMGTLMSMLIPYAIFYGITWLILFSTWFLLGIPFGPGSAVFLH